MNELTLALVQTDILWEDISGNLNRIYPLITSVKGKCDIIVLPEMFTTGFSLNSEILAENTDGKTMQLIQQWAKENEVAICGSFICKENDKYFNRGFFITPMQRFFYDKHHLFRMGDEPRHFNAGKDQLIINYKGWNISLLICYDLRFPVWCRNIENNYDLQIFTANWPVARQSAWDILLRARAIENQAYVAGVNRIGLDGHNIIYGGGSTIIDMKGEILAQADASKESILIQKLRKDILDNFRKKFPAWKDADSFKIR